MADDVQATVSEYLRRHEEKDQLRFITCGSVDDGKSTLIGRLLHDTRLLLDDQMAALEADSKRYGTQNGALDFALLVDGLEAEREQGITIDVAYRYFGTDRRKFIVADCPGHEQYTRNMATGASTADLAVVLVDARKGLLTQTRRHSYIVSLLGIRHVVLAVNKMDLVEFDQTVFDEISAEYRNMAAGLKIPQVTSIPIAALKGDNVLARSDAMPWYKGLTLLDHLKTVDVERIGQCRGFRMPVQWVSRSEQGFRGFAGTVVGREVAVGDRVAVLPSGQRSHISAIVTKERRLERAGPGQALTLMLADEVDVSRGDVIADAGNPPEVADQFAVHLLWLGDEPLLPGRPYWLKIGTRTAGAQVAEIRHKVDVETQEALQACSLETNEVGWCNIYLDQPVAFEPYVNSRELGGFILIDRKSNATVAAGTLECALRRATNIHWQYVDVDKEARARIKHQRGRCVWFTGLSGAGKSTIANLVEKRLHAVGRHTYILDGDNIRHGLNKDLGFTDEDRVENIRRVAEVARLMVDAGLIVLASFISPFRAERRMAREMFAKGEFIEVFVDTPLEVAEQRDAKGLYAKARAGLIPNFTGIDSEYERPEHAEIVLQTTDASPDVLAEQLVGLLLES